MAPIVLALCAIFTQRKREQNTRAFVSSSHLKKRLISEGSTLPWWISTILITLATILIFISLAEPTLGKKTIELPSKGRKIYLAVDCSKSMLVKDVTPDRLTVAKTAALEILEAFPQEKVGLISFAGSAWLEAPLTADHHALRESILEMSTSTIPYGGSSSGALLDIITETHKDEDLSEALLIILSDGEFHEAPSERKIKKAGEAGLRIFTLGFGTLAGDYIPNENSIDGLYRDPRRGQTILSSLKPEPLEKISDLGGGTYFKGDDFSFMSRLSTAVSGLKGEDNTSKNLVVHNHIYYYFLIPALLLLFLSALTPHLWKMIKSPASALLFLFFLPLTDVEAAPPFVSDTSTQTEEKVIQETPPASLSADQESEERLAELSEEALRLSKKADEAKGKNIQRYRFSQGVAEYKSEQFSSAVESFSESLLSGETELQAESHYNIGNSLYKFGTQLAETIPTIQKPEDQVKLMQAIIRQWEDSLDHYTGTINLLPDHANARENYEYVKKLLEQMKEQQQQMMEQMQGEGEGEPREGEGDGEGESEDEGKGGGSNGKNDEDGWTEEELEEKIKEAKENGYDPTEGSKGEEENEGAGGEEEADIPEPSGDRQEDLERRPGETKEDYAERKLREGSDAETGNLKSRRGYFRRPDKDW